MANCRTRPTKAMTMNATIRLKHPGAGQPRDLVADIAAEQIERAVREVDVAHQAEDQREPARDHEIEAAERDPVEQRVEEDALAADQLLELGRPDRENQIDQHADQDQDDERPGRVACDEVVHAAPRQAWPAALGRPTRDAARMNFLPNSCFSLGFRIVGAFGNRGARLILQQHPRQWADRPERDSPAPGQRSARLSPTHRQTQTGRLIAARSP